MKTVLEEDFLFEWGAPSKMVMVGDMLSSDIIFGNTNRMTTVWAHGLRDYYN